MVALPRAFLRHHRTGDEYQLMDRHESAEVELQTLDNEAGCKSTARLPARPLQPHHRRWSLIGVPFVVILCVAALITLLDKLKYLLPDPDFYDLLPGASSLSCDLTLPGNNTVENAFMIDLRSATHLSFSEAKLIDVTWDLFIGQGGRLLMAWVSYRAYMDELVCLLETTAVSYELYTYLTFDTTSLLTTWKSTKALFQSRDWRSRVFLTWFALATIYTLAFPTLMGAATGYVNPSTPGYMMTDGSIVMAQSPNLTYCIPVMSGELIGLTNQTIANGSSVDSTGYDYSPYDSYSGRPANASLYNVLNNYENTNGSIPVWMLPNGTNTTTLPSYRYTDNTTLENQLQDCYSTIYAEQYGDCPLDFTTNITIKNHTHVFKNYVFRNGRDYETQRYCYKGALLPEDLMRIAQCVTQDYFVWGFSSLLLYIIASIQLAWIIGMLLVWLHANLRSQLLQTGRGIRGNYRAAADLAEAMQETLGDEFCAYPDSELAKELEREGLGLRYRTTDVRDTGLSHIGLAKGGFLVLDRSKLYGKRRKVEGKDM